MKRILFFTLIICCQLLGHAKITMPYIFSNHMVLQRNTEIAIWGKATPNDKITIVFNENSFETTADVTGSWKVKLPKESAGGPYTLSILENNKAVPSIVLYDVMIGDVWLASGQSNMEWQVQQSYGADKEIPLAYNKNLRYFNVPHNISTQPLENTVESSWQISDSTTVKTMSAVAYYFAKKLQSNLDIPIGIVQSTWGGTPVEAWTSRDMLLAYPGIQNRVLQNDSINNNHFIKDSLDLIRFWEIVYQPQNGSDTIYSKPEFDDSKWKTIQIPGVIRDWETEIYEGIIWLRKKIELQKDFTETDIKINLGYPEMNYSLYFNGHEICKTQWNANLTHTYTIPSNIINKGENTIALRIAALWGGGGLNNPADSIYLSNNKLQLSIIGAWKYIKDLEPSTPKIHNYHYYPSYLYNAMINPIVPYTIKGFLWYQGEANDSVAYNYRTMLPLMVNDWRMRWQQGNLPFLLVQLPNYMKREQQPSDGNWAVLRESQQKTLNLPNTGMASIIDIGETNNIHPKEKIEVGNRLALVAQKLVYNENILASGPIYEHYEIKNNEIIIHFLEVGTGLKTSDGTAIKGFSIAGNDKTFHWAEARIDGNKVIVKSNKVAKPIAVRYAWANNPECNLINSSNLPTWPFRTDTWKVVTQP